jgi:phospholipid/cholesterol/gamma-HCH transport system ATP-binding protein
MLYEGQILFTGTPDEVRRTDNPFVRQFVEGLATGPITDKDQAAVATRAEAASARAAAAGRPHA